MLLIISLLGSKKLWLRMNGKRNRKNEIEICRAGNILDGYDFVATKKALSWLFISSFVWVKNSPNKKMLLLVALSASQAGPASPAIWFSTNDEKKIWKILTSECLSFFIYPPIYFNESHSRMNSKTWLIKLDILLICYPLEVCEYHTM